MIVMDDTGPIDDFLVGKYSRPRKLILEAIGTLRDNDPMCELNITFLELCIQILKDVQKEMNYSDTK